MPVVLLEANLQLLLESPAGPVGLDLSRRATRVEEKARENASGPIIGIRSGNLVNGIRTEITVGVRGLEARIGTDASNDRPWDGLSYPAFVHRGEGEAGFWLEQAISEVI